MRWCVFVLVICLCGSLTSKAQQANPLPDGPKPQTGTIVGTVIDVNDDPVPDATIVLEGPVPGDPRQAMSNDNGFFEFKALGPGTYHVTVSAKGFANWTSPAIKPSRQASTKS